MKPRHHASPGIALLAAMAFDIGAAPLPLPDLAYGGHGDGIARIVAGDPATSDSFAAQAIVQVDGRLVLIGTTQQQIVLARLDAGGQPDATFGPNHDGLFHSAFAGYAANVAQSGNGKLIYAGNALNGDAMIVGRLTASGLPDTGFFLSGHRLIGSSALMSGATQSYVGEVLALPDGKMVLLGAVLLPGPPNQVFSCVMRLSEDGSTDTGFGNAGRTCIAPPELSPTASQPLSGLVLGDGRILLAGGARHAAGSGIDMAVARLSANGALDTSFGPQQDGWSFIGFDQGGTMIDIAQAISVDGQGRILLAGHFEGVSGNDIGIVRLSPDGLPDPSFGFQGRVQLALDPGGWNDDRAHSITARPDGGILVGGSTQANAGPAGLAVLFKSNGDLDPRFGDGGIFLPTDPAGPPQAIVESHRQILDGDHLYLIGNAANASNRQEIAVRRTVMPLFADGFDP